MTRAIKGGLWLGAILLLLLASGCGPCCMRQHGGMDGCRTKMASGQPAAATDEAARKDVLYSCACGPECKCNSVSKTPGNCACGKPLVWGHLVRVEGDEALLCRCNEGCQCRIDPKDATRCGCGNPVKRVSLKGSGLFFCNCGGSCGCNTVTTGPAECRCGMPLKKAE